MKTEHLLTGGIPAVLYGSAAAQGYLFLHGQMGCKEEAEEFAQVVCPKGRQVLSIDLPGHGERRDRGGELLPWTAVPEIQTALDWAGRRWESVSLRANSIGAYLAMLAWEDPGPRPVGLPHLGHGGTDPDHDGLGWCDGGGAPGTGRDPHLLRPDPVLGVPDLGAEAPGPHMELSHPHPLWERRQHDAPTDRRGICPAAQRGADCSRGRGALVSYPGTACGDAGMGGERTVNTECTKGGPDARVVMERTASRPRASATACCRRV